MMYGFRLQVLDIFRTMYVYKILWRVNGHGKEDATIDRVLRRVKPTKIKPVKRRCPRKIRELHCSYF